MTERACTICGSTEGPFDVHHIARRSNHETATVDVCRGDCHDEQTAHHRRAGLTSRRGQAISDPTLALLHDLIEGFAGILAAHARRTGSPQLARDAGFDRRVLLRLLASIGGERPGALDPDAIFNDRPGGWYLSRHSNDRASGARRSQRPDRRSLPALARVLPALMTAISTPSRPGVAALLPGSSELLQDFTVGDAVRLFAADSVGRLARGLAALEDHPRARELATIVERDRHTVQDAVAETGSVEAAVSLRTLAGHWIQLASTLANSAGQRDALTAIDHFQRQRAGDE